MFGQWGEGLPPPIPPIKKALLIPSPEKKCEKPQFG